MNYSKISLCVLGVIALAPFVRQAYWILMLPAIFGDGSSDPQPLSNAQLTLLADKRMSIVYIEYLSAGLVKTHDVDLKQNPDQCKYVAEFLRSLAPIQSSSESKPETINLRVHLQYSLDPVVIDVLCSSREIHYDIEGNPWGYTSMNAERMRAALLQFGILVSEEGVAKAEWNDLRMSHISERSIKTP